MGRASADTQVPCSSISIVLVICPLCCDPWSTGAALGLVASAG